MSDALLAAARELRDNPRYAFSVVKRSGSIKTELERDPEGDPNVFFMVVRRGSSVVRTKLYAGHGRLARLARM